MTFAPEAQREAASAVSIEESIACLQASWPQAVKADDRAGYEGIVVDSDHLLAVARAIRDDLGFDYLSSATAVDYLGAGDHLEMVYHAYRTSGGGPLVFKAQTDRDRPKSPRWFPSGAAPIFRNGKPGTCSASSLSAIPTSSGF